MVPQWYEGPLVRRLHPLLSCASRSTFLQLSLTARNLALIVRCTCALAAPWPAPARPPHEFDPSSVVLWSSKGVPYPLPLGNFLLDRDLAASIP